jgi:hypothetical protein
LATSTDLLVPRLAELDDDELAAIIRSAAQQRDYLARFGASEAHARVMSEICGIIATLAEIALLERRTGVTIDH